MEIYCRKNINIDLQYYNKAMWKLGCDLELCTRIGAIIGNGMQREIDLLGEYGANLGYILRLSEDIKDTLNKFGNLPHRLQHESVPLPLLLASKCSDNNKDRRRFNTGQSI